MQFGYNYSNAKKLSDMSNEIKFDILMYPIL